MFDDVIYYAYLSEFGFETFKETLKKILEISEI